MELSRNSPARFSRTELHCHVFPVLAALASYHSALAPPLQQRLIKCLEVGATKVILTAEPIYTAVSIRGECFARLMSRVHFPCGASKSSVAGSDGAHSAS